MTETARTYNLSLDEAGALADAAQAVRDGQCIVLPTDTVYGIGAIAFDGDAVRDKIGDLAGNADLSRFIL